MQEKENAVSEAKGRIKTSHIISRAQWKMKIWAPIKKVLRI